MIGIGIAILMAVNLYILVLWQHPDDKNQAYWPKALVLLGLTLAEGTVLFLPLDVANNGGNVDCNQSWSDVFCGSIDMTAAWSALFYLIFIFAFFLIPYTIFFYEEDDTEVLEGKFNFAKTFIIATKYMLVVAFLVALVVGISFYFLGISDIPVQQYAASTIHAYLYVQQYTTSSFMYCLSTPLTTAQLALAPDVASTGQEVTLNVTFGLYLMAIMSFVGWFLFAVFAGLGMPGISIDLVRGYQHRPQRLDRAQIAALELRTKELVEIGTMLKSTRSDRKLTRGNYIAKRQAMRAESTEFKRFKQMVYILEEDYQQMVLCKEYSTKYNPLKPLFWMLVGIVSGCICVLWLIHMVVYMLATPPYALFLNAYFNWFDKWFPLFGAISIGLFAMYLLVAAVKGCFKFGLRLMWFTLHPMKLNETYMNSFLFNVGIILMCVPAVIQFSVQAFSAYLVSADINSFFNVQVKYLRFFRYFYVNDVFVFALLIITLLSTAFLGVRPSDTPASTKQVREALRKLGAHTADYEASRAK
ncbi:LMBR1-like membrane protein [Tribonema minus]|uniref:LMBR1-like membrane protein n=1 Tax=Tribonema minus TaxID=303371 RepID=A0A835Z009_9STRA|nr:LMBR1-like membrane protein [Tribonema minus]